MKKFMNITWVYIFLTFSNISLAQNVLYVSADGNDNDGDGTISSPYLTIQFALNQCSENDTVVLRGGTYTLDNELRIDISNITMKSYENEWAVIKAPIDNENIGVCIWYHDPVISGGRLERLEITGGYYYGLKFESNWNWGYPISERSGVSNIKVVNCEIHDTGRDCLKLTPASDNITIESCEIYNSGIGPANSGNPNAEGIDCVNGDNLIVRNCYIHDTSTNGIYSKGGSINTIVEGNLIMNTGNGGALLGFYTDEEWFDTSVNPEYYENISGTIRNNIIINTKMDGIGLYAAYEPKVYNNTVINGAQEIHAALFINTGYIWNDEIQDMIAPPSVNIDVRNNIFTISGSSSMPVAQIRYYEDDVSSNMQGENNIDYNRYYKEGGAIFDDGIDWQDLDFEAWKNSTNLDLNSTVGEPGLDVNYHLKESSFCVDNGVDTEVVTSDFDGGTRTTPFDIGADEYNSGEILTIPPAENIIGTGNGNTNQGTTSIFENLSNEIICYPNPAKKHIFLKSDLFLNDLTGIKLVNLKGEILKVNTEITGNYVKIHAENLISGIYFIKITQGRNQYTKKVFVIK